MAQNYSLNFNDKTNSLNPQVRQRMIDTFYTVYPQIVSRFNNNAPEEVKFTIDPDLVKNPAEALGDSIRFSADWLRDHPEDTDTVTHELMHVVQAYPRGNPGWLVEGIADYVRNKYGVNNGPAGWSMPPYSPGQNYTNSYRITASFLTWLENRIHPSVIEELDSHARNRTYNDNTWVQLTGQTVEQLWDRYANNRGSDSIISGGIYKLINNKSGKALDVDHSGTENGTNVQIWDDNGSHAQMWRIEDVDNGLYKISNIISNKSLDVDHSGTPNVINVYIWGDNNSSAQRWRLQPIDGKDVFKVISSISGKALDVYHSGKDNGTNVQIWDDNGSGAQQWRLIRVS